MSREFRCALAGLGMTLFAWYGPWSWPGWPATTLLDFFLAHAAPSVMSPIAKAFGFVGLIIVNSGFWALITCALVRMWKARGRFT